MLLIILSIALICASAVAAQLSKTLAAIALACLSLAALVASMDLTKAVFVWLGLASISYIITVIVWGYRNKQH